MKKDIGKKEIFIERAEKKVDKILKAIDDLGKLSDSKRFDYSTEQCKQYFEVMRERINQIEKAFYGVYISKNDINAVDGPYNIRFSGNNNMENIMRKSKLLGLKTIPLQSNLLAVFADDTVTLFSDKEIYIEENASRLFMCSEFKSIDLRGVNTSICKRMRQMFAGSRAHLINLQDVDTSSVRDITDIFFCCRAEIIGISHFDS